MGIVEFLDENQYPKALSANDFPLSSTEFKNVFTFAVNFIIPGYEITNNRIELELPNFLKEIGYPTQVNLFFFA